MASSSAYPYTSGTGTTAFYLHSQLRKQLSALSLPLNSIEVIAVPNVGDSTYLLSQMQTLSPTSTSFPTILTPLPKLDGTKKTYLNF